MALFESEHFDAHERVVFVHDARAGLRAIIALHDTRRGPALGGCRAWVYTDETAALDDVLRLSRGMTYKAACAELPYGGGKCVVLLDPARGKHPALMPALGRAIDDLGGRYITGEDVGTTSEDMAALRAVTPHVLGAPPGMGGSGDPSPSTALGCFHGIRAAVRERRAREDLAGTRVAIQGLGNVGWSLAERLHAAGATLLVSDLRAERVRAAQEAFGAQAVDAARIHAVDADVFAPCALGAVISDATLPDLCASVVAGAANNQLAHARHAQALADRGILYAPDYVINAGGMIQLALERAGRPQELPARLENIGRTLGTIFGAARRAGITTAAAAEAYARQRLEPAGAAR